MLELILPSALFLASFALADMAKSPSVGAVSLGLEVLLFRFAILMREHAEIMASNNSLSLSFSFLGVVVVESLIVLFLSVPIYGWIEHRQGRKTARAMGVLAGVTLLFVLGWKCGAFEHYLLAEWMKEPNFR